MKRLKEIVEESDTKAGRLFDLVVQFAIVVSLVSFSVETLPHISTTTTAVLRGIEVVTVIFFTIEYLLRVLVATNRRGFVFSFLGLIDLFAILPFYISGTIDLRALRIVRMLRVFHVLKFVRYNKALQRFRRAFISIKEELILFLIATGMLMYLASVGIYYFERNAQPEAFASVFHAMWWTVVTLTTVGYGDVVPVTIGGRIFTSIVLVLGLGVIAVPSGLLASALTREEGE